MILKKGCFANLPSEYHRKWSAQSAIDVQVLDLFIKKSSVVVGNRHGKARVKKFLMVNSETGSPSRVDQGVVTTFLLYVTGLYLGPTTCTFSTTFSTSPRILMSLNMLDPAYDQLHAPSPQLFSTSSRILMSLNMLNRFCYLDTFLIEGWSGGNMGPRPLGPEIEDCLCPRQSIHLLTDHLITG